MLTRRHDEVQLVSGSQRVQQTLVARPADCVCVCVCFLVVISHRAFARSLRDLDFTQLCVCVCASLATSLLPRKFCGHFVVVCRFGHLSAGRQVLDHRVAPLVRSFHISAR